MFGTEVQQIQLTLDEAKKKVKLGEALERLERNKDFKLLIDEEFLKQESIRQVSLLSDPAFQTPHMQASIVADMRAGSTLQAFFRLVSRNASMSAQAVHDSEEQLAIIRGNGEDI